MIGSSASQPGKSAMLLVSAVALLGAPLLVLSQSIFTLDWQQYPIEPEKGMDFYMAGNVHTPINNTAASLFPFDASVVKMRLPPCGARTMHIHMNVDELHYVLSGSFLASCALPNGTIISDTVKEGQSFIAPKNFIHELSNPSCTDDAHFMGFYNHYDASNNNIGAGVYGIQGGAFKTYVDPARADSLANAIGIFAYVPECLARCGLGEKGGMLPPVEGDSQAEVDQQTEEVDVQVVVEGDNHDEEQGDNQEDQGGEEEHHHHGNRKLSRKL